MARKRLDRNPRNQVLLERLAIMLLRNEEDAEAERLFARSYQIKPNARNSYHLGMFREKRRQGSGRALLRQALRFQPQGLYIALALGGSEYSARAFDGWEKTVETLPNSKQTSQPYDQPLDLPDKDLKVRAAGLRILAIGPTKTYVLERSTRRIVSTIPSQLTFPGGNSQGYEVGNQTVDLWQRPSALLAADEHHLLLAGDYTTFVANQQTGLGSSRFSGGDRWPQDVSYLAPGGKYVLHDGVLSVAMCDADSGKGIWTCAPAHGESQMEIIRVTDTEVWVFASYTGRVSAYALSGGQKLWERWHWQLP